MNQLTAVIITYNEERNIARCLESIHTIADEVVVVDSFSTDRTPQICQQFGVRFIQHAWEGYAPQKNYANSLASYDLILSLDADEALSDELVASILKIKNQDIENQVFSMNRLMNYCGTWIHHGSWYPETKTRIFDRRIAYWENLKVHEVLHVPAGFKTVHLKGDILHYSYYTVEEHRRQFDKFATLWAEGAFERGKKVTLAGAYVHCFWRFLRDYFFKLGFLDGRYGLIISKINSKNVYDKYIRTIALYKNQK